MELPSLVDLFQVGSLIPCVITDLESTKHGHKRIKLSADPKDVNKGIHPSAIREGMVRNQGGGGGGGELGREHLLLWSNSRGEFPM